MMKAAYVSGPMTGYENFNFELFDSVRDELVASGVKVFSPADHDRETVDRVWPGKRPEDFPGYATGDIKGYFDAITSGGEFTLDTMLAWDFTVIANECDAIVMLPGWELSSGGKAERVVAEATNKQVWLAQWSGGGWLDPVTGLIYYAEDPGLEWFAPGWYFVLDPEQKRMRVTVKESE